MNWQTVDFIKLLRMASTEIALMPKRLAYMSALLRPLTIIHDDTLYKMQHDSTVVSLEKMLNEYLQIPTYNAMSHIATRQVIIVDAPKLAPAYVYQPDETQPLYLGTAYLDRNTLIGYQFVVKIPIGVAHDETQLRDRIDYYKLAGKQYTIETY